MLNANDDDFSAPNIITFSAKRPNFPFIHHLRFCVFTTRENIEMRLQPR